MGAILEEMAMVLRLGEVLFEKGGQQVVNGIPVFLIQFFQDQIEKRVVRKFLEVVFQGVKVPVKIPAIHGGSGVLLYETVGVLAHGEKVAPEWCVCSCGAVTMEPWPVTGYAALPLSLFDWA